MYKVVGLSELLKLRKEAEVSPLGHHRILLHEDTCHLTQEMVICASNKSYFRPHKHPNDRSESYHVLEGIITVDFFNDTGHWLSQITLGAIGTSYPFLYRLNKPFYHWVRPVSDWAIYHEVLTGPYDDRVKVVIEAQFSPHNNDTKGIVEFYNLVNRLSGKGGA